MSVISELYTAPDTDFDKSIADIALAVHQSLNDNLFCKSLKDKIMLRPDGDYEVILKSFVNNHTDLGKTALFTNLLNSKLDAKGDDQQGILEKFPNLQIAIPVNAEKWDGSSKLWVLYLPSDYDDMITKEVPAISPTGEKRMFNIEKQPDFPVIVVGLNERSNENGDLKYDFNMLKEVVKLNHFIINSKDGDGFTSFSATPVTNAMAVGLSWTFTYPYYLEPYDHYFEIYRDDLLGGGPQKIGEADSWQTFYYDTYNILPSRTYVYYVVAKVDTEQTYYHDYYSAYFWSTSDEAAIPQIPNFTSNLSVDCIAPNTIRLIWTINNISNWTNLRIERSTAYNPIPVVIAELPITAINFTDYLASPYPSSGVTYHYNLVVYNVNNNAQQAYYCEEMLSNRIDNQFLKVTHVQFNSFDDMRRYEAWTRGAPEIELYVHKVTNGTADEICGDVLIGGPASTGFDLDPIYTIGRWALTDSKVYTISLNEDDGGDLDNLEINIGSTAKVTLPMGIEITKTFSVKGIIGKLNNDDFIGKGYLYWWDNADGQDVYCGNYCKVTLVSSQN